MRKMLQVCATLTLILALVAPAAAEQPGPDRNYVKELLLHLPDWVKNASGTWEGMSKTNKGWEPKGTAIETSEPIFNHQTKRPYTRSIYEVTFKENPAPPPRTYTATVVFEDFGQNVRIPPPPQPSPTTEWRPKMAPVLVTKGVESIEQDPISKPRWEYVSRN